MTELKLENSQFFTIQQPETALTVSCDVEKYGYDDEWPTYRDFYVDSDDSLFHKERTINDRNYFRVLFLLQKRLGLKRTRSGLDNFISLPKKNR